jgi:mRNA interferase MazF
VLIDSKFATAICAPVFTFGEALSSQVQVGIEEGLKHPSWIMCDNLMSLRKSELTHFIGSLTKAKLSELNKALAVALGL